jgi:hypothetical protein
MNKHANPVDGQTSTIEEVKHKKTAVQKEIPFATAVHYSKTERTYPEFY